MYICIQNEYTVYAVYMFIHLFFKLDTCLGTVLLDMINTFWFDVLLIAILYTYTVKFGVILLVFRKCHLQTRPRNISMFSKMLNETQQSFGALDPLNVS